MDDMNARATRQLAQRNKVERMRSAFTFFALLFILACSSSPVDPDEGDATEDAPKFGETHDSSTEASTDDVTTNDAPIDASVDVAADVKSVDASDASPDVLDAAVDAFEAGAGGNICPGVGLCKGACSCDAGYTGQWWVDDPNPNPDSGAYMSYLCGHGDAPTNPSCPKGWKCSGYNLSNQLVTLTCP